MLQVLVFAATGFWMLMIVDCARNDPDRNTWLWILLLLNIPGAFIYFLVRRLPYLNLPAPVYFRRWMRRNDIWNAEAAVRNIGKAHQFVGLGNVLYEVRSLDKAVESYEQALDKEPQNPHALWGIASIAMETKRFETARDHLQVLVKLEPDYKFGAASLLYGQALFALQEWDVAELHLQKDIKHWSHPESCIMLATIQMQRGELETAQNCLETMVAKLKSSPRFHVRKKQPLLNQAEVLLRKLRNMD